MVAHESNLIVKDFIPGQTLPTLTIYLVDAQGNKVWIPDETLIIFTLSKSLETSSIQSPSVYPSKSHEFIISGVKLNILPGESVDLIFK